MQCPMAPTHTHLQPRAKELIVHGVVAGQPRRIQAAIARQGIAAKYVSDNNQLQEQLRASESHGSNTHALEHTHAPVFEVEAALRLRLLALLPALRHTARPSQQSRQAVHHAVADEAVVTPRLLDDLLQRWLLPQAAQRNSSREEPTGVSWCGAQLRLLPPSGATQVQVQAQVQSPTCRPAPSSCLPCRGRRRCA